MIDFFELEPLLIARVESTVSEFAGCVYGAPELEQFGGKNRQPPAPSCDVVFGGYQVLESRGDGMTRLQQTWYVVPRVKNVRSVKQGSDARSDGGPLVSAVINALLGWRPGDRWKRLEMTSAPAPYYLMGTLEVPLGFVSQTVIKPGEFYE